MRRILKLSYTLSILLMICTPDMHAQQVIRWGEQDSYKPLTASDSAYIHSLLAEGHRLTDGNTDSALALLHEALSKSEQHHYTEGIALSLMTIATCHAVKNDIITARKYLNRAYPYCLESTAKDKLLVDLYRNWSVAYKYAGHTDSVMEAIRKAIPHLERLNDTSYFINTYNYIGSVLIDNQDYENAYPYVHKAEKLNARLNTDKLVSYINLGYIYTIRNDMDSMYHVVSKALKGARELNWSRYERSASILLTRYYLVKGDNQRADEYARNAIRLIDRHAADNRVYVYRILSSTYKDQQDLQQALAYGNMALEHLKPEQKVRKDVIHLYGLMAEIHHSLGNHRLAYEMHLEYNRLTDSLHVEERNKAVDLLEKQFQLSEKEKEIVLKEKEIVLKENQILLQQSKVRSRNIWIIVIGGGLLIGFSLAGFLYSLYRSSRRKMYIMRQRKEIDELKAMMNGEENERKRIAIDLHDNVGGLLTSVSYSIENIKKNNESLPGEKSLHKVGALVEEIREEIRKTAHTLMPDVLLRHGLEKAVRMYCVDVERDTGLVTDVQVQGHFDHLQKDIQLSFYRIVQELLQNILKHAEATQAFVQLHSGSGLISLTIEDNGKGFDPQAAHEGMGLINIENRLLIHNGKMSVNTEPGGGTSVYIEVGGGPE